MEKSQGSCGTHSVKAAFQRIKPADITELKCLATPPKPVVDLIVAVQFLLGQPSHIATEWRYGQKLLVGKGKDGLVKQLSDLEVQSVTAENAGKAREVLKPYTVERIENVSKGCVGLYCWAWAVLQAVESGGGENQ